MMSTISMVAALGGLAFGVSVMIALIYYIVLKPTWRALEGEIDAYRRAQERANGIDD